LIEKSGVKKIDAVFRQIFLEPETWDAIPEDDDFTIY